jgi:hypothetical protein
MKNRKHIYSSQALLPTSEVLGQPEANGGTNLEPVQFTNPLFPFAVC